MRMFAVVVSIALLMFVVFPHASTAVAQATVVQAKHVKQAKTPTPPTTHKCRGNPFHRNAACY